MTMLRFDFDTQFFKLQGSSCCLYCNTFEEINFAACISKERRHGYLQPMTISKYLYSSFV